MSECPSCGRRSDDGLVCSKCTRHTVNDLAAIAALWADLEITATRQAKVGPTGPPARSMVVPLPFDERAAQLAQDVRLALVAWVETFDLGDVGPSKDPAPICLWLVERTNRWRGHEHGHRFVEEMQDCARRIVKVIDAPPVMIFLGRCEEIVDVSEDESGWEHEAVCNALMYARLSDLTYECRDCHAVYDVPARRSEIVRRSLGAAGTVAVCTKILGAFGLPVTADTIQNWARPKRRRSDTGEMEIVGPARLVSVGRNKYGQKLYSVADVEALARELANARYRKPAI